MTLERRQFIETSRLAGQGENRELTVDSSEGRVYVHTTSRPQGHALAKLSELDELRNYILNNLRPTFVDMTREVENWLNIADAPDLINGTNYWPWSPIANARQTLLNQGYRKMTIVSFSMIKDTPVTYDLARKIRAEVIPDESAVLHGDMLIGETTVRIDNDRYYVFSVPIYAKTDTYGPIRFRLIYVDNNEVEPPVYSSQATEAYIVKEGDIDYRGWSLVYEDDSYWWKANLKPIVIARAVNGLTITPVRLGVVTFAVNKDNSEDKFSGWYSGSGTNELTATPVVYIKATEGETEPPLGFTCRVDSTFNVN